jgi:hypothetical protein
VGSEGTVRRIASALGVSLPRPREVPNLLPESREDLRQYRGSAPKADGTIAKTLFRVRDEGLVDAKLHTGEQAILGNLRAIRAAAVQIDQVLARDRALDDLVAARLAAPAPTVPPTGVQAPDVEWAVLVRERQEHLQALNAALQGLMAQRTKVYGDALARLQAQIDDTRTVIARWTAAPIVRPQPA